MSVQYVYVMKGLSKTYPGGKQVLKDIWLSFFPGAKIGIVGHNGAGKSTLLKIMAGIEKEFNGEAWAADGVRVGYLEQEPSLDRSGMDRCWHRWRVALYGAFVAHGRRAARFDESVSRITR